MRESKDSYAAEAHRQSLAAARSPRAGEDQAFIDALQTHDGLDDRTEVLRLLANLHASLPELKALLEQCD